MGALKSPIVLIDDDLLVHAVWRIEAHDCQRPVVIARALGDLDLDQLPRDATFYIDQNLGDGVTGVWVGEELSKQGFKDLYITSGQADMPSGGHKLFKGVVGKSFPALEKNVFCT